MSERISTAAAVLCILLLGVAVGGLAGYIWAHDFGGGTRADAQTAYYRGVFDVCLAMFADAAFCNESVSKMAAQDWYARESAGFAWEGAP